MHLNLVFLVSTPRVVHAQKTVSLVALQFLPLKEFCFVVPVTEEQCHRSALFALTLSLGSVLHHRPHWRNASAQPDHNLGFVLSFRNGHTPSVQVARNMFVCAVVTQEMGG